jgi:hypothetical protein
MMAVDESGKEITVGISGVLGSDPNSDAFCKVVSVEPDVEEVDDDITGNVRARQVMTVKVTMFDGSAQYLMGVYDAEFSQEHEEPCYRVDDFAVMAH